MLNSLVQSQPSAGRLGLACLVVCLTVVQFGCTQNPYIAGPGGPAWQGQTAQVNPAEARMAELTRRVQLMDANNTQLTTQLAASEQQRLTYQQELDLMRRQLADTTTQFEAAKIAASSAANQVKNFQASTKLRGNTTIRANNNLSQLAQRLNLGSLPVRVDGDVIRIVVPSDQIFQPGSATFHSQATSILDPIATQLKTVFPRQKIAVEGHTDNVAPYGGQVATSHQLASAQTSAILDLLARRNGIPPRQMFAVAQGANIPAQANDSAPGRAANRRIEFVIYPDTVQ